MHPTPVEQYRRLVASTQPRYSSVEEARAQIVLGERFFQSFTVAGRGEFRCYRLIKTRDPAQPTMVVEDNPVSYYGLVEARRKAITFIGEQVLSLQIPELPSIN